MEILNEDERSDLYDQYEKLYPKQEIKWDEFVAQAEQKNTMRQVKKWGEEDCTHSYGKKYGYMKRECHECWQELTVDKEG